MGSQFLLFSSLYDNVLEFLIHFSGNFYFWEQIVQKTIKNTEIHLGYLWVIEIS